MFWENFIELCNEKKISPNAVCAKLGFSVATATKWKKGATPRDSTIKKIADFFDIDPSYFENDICYNDTGIITISKKYKEKNKTLIIQNGLYATFIDYDEDTLKEVEETDYNSLEEGIANIYIYYLREKNIPVTINTISTIQNNIKKALLESKQIAKENKIQYHSKDNIIPSYDVINNNYYDEITEQEQILLNSFRSTSEEGRQRMIQSILNIHDEFEKKEIEKNSKASG